MPDTRFVERVAIRNYKSIAACDVHLSALSFLVGPNGSGKSNFLDALRFVADALRSSLDHALRDRGGINDVRRRSSGHPTNFGVRIEFRIPTGGRGYYAFTIGARSNGGFVVSREECLVRNAGTDEPAAYYEVVEGEVRRSTLSVAPAGSTDRLFLVSASGAAAFRPVFDALSTMGFYNLNPGAIRELQPPDPGELLSRDGSNLPSVLGNLHRYDGLLKARIEEYLSKVVPGIAGADTKEIGPRETIEFRQQVAGSKYPWRFLATNMSDGTLRALAVLVALFQGSGESKRRSLLVGIEEPETALHPAATEILVDGLRDASVLRQIIVTSHSPELLDNDQIADDEILAVVSEEGETKVGALDEAGRSVLKDHLYTAGELLRMGQLRPDPAAMELRTNQLNLFGSD